MRKFLCGIVMCLATLLATCATVPPTEDIAIADVLVSPMTAVLDYETSEDGLIVLELDLPWLGLSKFILDTGATTSAVYKQALPSTAGIGKVGEPVRVHGMNDSEMRPTITLPQIMIGSSQIDNVNLAILEKPQNEETLLRQVKGVIGLDVVSSYRLLIEPDQQKLFFIDKQTLPIVFDSAWKSIPMTQTPFEQDVYGLHFLKVRVNGEPTFALLDTGAAFNVMNWNFKRLWQLSMKHRGLRHAWEHSGSIGEFKPEGLANLQGIKAGGYRWPKQTFSVFDLTTFNDVGLQDKPLMIAGMPFFKDKAILIDFASDVIWIQTKTLPPS